MRITAIAVSIGLLAAPGAARAEPRAPELVSIIRLIAMPERYTGKRIAVIGYCWLEFEGDALYLSEEDHRHLVAENALWLTLTAEQAARYASLRGKYVMAIGTLRAGRGHGGNFAASVEVERLEDWSAPAPAK
jgi:hypothetical protein